MSSTTLERPRGVRFARREGPLAALAVACVVALAAAYVVFLRTTAGQRLDQRVLDQHHLDEHALSTRPAALAIHSLLGTISEATVVVVLAMMLAMALLRRRPALALITAVTIGGAALWTEALKHVLPRPALIFADPYINTFPSGHTTVAFSVGLAAVLIAPARLRRLVAAGAFAYGAAVGIAVVAAGWHRPSDVAGALLVATGWAALVSLVSARYVPGIFTDPPSRTTTQADDSPPGRRPLQLGALALLGGYFALLALLLARHGGDISWVLPSRSFLAVSAAIVVLAGLLTVALLAALSAAAPASGAALRPGRGEGARNAHERSASSPAFPG